jgi:hypothetical protein
MKRIKNINYQNIKDLTLSLEHLSLLYYNLRLRNNIKIKYRSIITDEGSFLNIIGEEINRLGFKVDIKKF